MASFPGQKSTGPALPNPPLNLAVTGVTISAVSLTWGAPIGGATTYNLYRNGTRIQTGLSSTTATDTGLTPGTSYTYSVTAVKTTGEGSRSNQAVGTTGALPNAPSALVVTSTTSSTVSLSWAAPVGGASTYNLYRNSIEVQSSISGTTTTDTGLSASTGYTYFVTGTNSFGEGPQSNSVVGTTTSSGQAVKWRPGNWIESDTVIKSTGGLSLVQSDIDAIASLPNVVGIMLLVTWANLQQSINVYDFSKLDPIVSYIKSKGKKWCLQVVGGDFNSTHPGTSDTSILPQYIQNNVALYGQAGYRVAGVTTQPGGASGWWGGDGNGNTYGAALWRPNVMAEWIKLGQAVAVKYDSDPDFEGYYQGEDSFYQGTGSTNGSDYNDATQENNWQNYLTACCTSFVTSNVWFSETFLQFQTNSIKLTNFITNGTFANHPPVLAQTDSFGAVQRSAIHTWGTQTYTGALGALGDRRNTLRFVAEVQAPDLGFFIDLGSAREDILAGLNIMKCTHVFWVRVPSPTAVSTKPGKYPCTFTANVTGTSGTLTTPWPLPSGTYNMVTTTGGIMTVTKGSVDASFSIPQTQTSPTISVNIPMIPENWFNGGTTTTTDNGTGLSYTDAGLGTYINNPANVLTNQGYPPDYP